MNHNRVVFDTNIIVSALMFPKSLPRQVIDQVDLLGTILISSATMLELNEVLTRKKFERYFSQEQRLNFMAKFFGKSEMVEILERVEICRDPKDDKFLELAVNGRANYLITGDQDLLVLNPFQETLIITVSQFFSS
ncbi:MAG: putative toxin-antitoxin system toxin component, PIN family [Snowella sp.]